MNKFTFLFLAFMTVFAATHAAMAETYYDILKRQYNSAKDPIAESDIDFPGHPSARLCVQINEDKPLVETYVMINKYKRIIEGQGPLLPEVEITKVLYRTYAGDTFMDRSFDFTETEFLPKEIKSSVSVSQGKKLWTLSVKKENNFLHFKRDLIEYGQVSYGYCFYPKATKGEGHAQF